MGYCGPGCNDPYCIGSPESGPYPAQVRVEDSWISQGYRIVYISARDYRQEKTDPISGRIRAVSPEEVVRKARYKPNTEERG